MNDNPACMAGFFCEMLLNQDADSYRDEDYASYDFCPTACLFPYLLAPGYAYGYCRYGYDKQAYGLCPDLDVFAQAQRYSHRKRVDARRYASEYDFAHTVEICMFTVLLESGNQHRASYI